jgi:hypothetical protein
MTNELHTLISDALNVLQNKRPNTPGLGAPITLLKRALEVSSAANKSPQPVQGVEEAEYPITPVIFFELKNGKYLASNGKEVDTAFLLKNEHFIYHNGGYLIPSGSHWQEGQRELKARKTDAVELLEELIATTEEVGNDVASIIYRAKRILK